MNFTNKNNINVSLHYVTNFQPNCTPTLIFNSKSEIKSNNSKIFCKNFLIFLIMVRKVLESNSVKFFIKPNFSNVTNILRAPYKNKISKHQITLSRYYIIVTFILNSDGGFFFKNNNSLFFFILQLKKFYSFFETNVCFQHRSILRFNFFYCKLFKISEYTQ